MSTNYGLIFSAAERLFALFQSKNVVTDGGDKDAESVLDNKGDRLIHVSFKNVHFSYPENREEQTSQVLKDWISSFLLVKRLHWLEHPAAEKLPLQSYCNDFGMWIMGALKSMMSISDPFASKLLESL